MRTAYSPARLAGMAVSFLCFALTLTAAGPAFAVERDHTCIPVDVTVFGDRVHIRCTAAASNGASNVIFFFAISTADQVVADRFISLGMSALTAQRPLNMRYDTDATKRGFSNATGCLAASCRIPLWFGLQ